ncbi:hypothetical protein DQP58_15950 [Mycobacterium colombiense]|uniref:AB hydrolase-1 domain-containing protein n=1 Tax=Mycobacterium colombiense TaxID=339268 RepID=A0A329KFU1_9MYCO|nr:hypothetical protein DQP58_15950 [Mycobacterium colombiense]
MADRAGSTHSRPSDVAGRRHHCLHHGGDGPPLLLIHGLGGNRHTRQHLLPGLARNHTVIAPDLPGHGDSDAPPGDYSLGAHATALRDLLLALEVCRVSIAGHSLGGGVALQTAYQFPERVDRLILISTGGLGPEVSYLLRAATPPGADAVSAALFTLPAALTKRLLAIVPSLVSGADADSIVVVLQGLRDGPPRNAFIRTARSVINWRGQSVSAARQLGPTPRCSGARRVGGHRHHHSTATPSGARGARTARSDGRDQRCRPLPARNRHRRAAAGHRDVSQVDRRGAVSGVLCQRTAGFDVRPRRGLSAVAAVRSRGH